MFKQALLCAVFLLGPMALVPAPAPDPGTLVLLLAGLLTIGAGRYATPRQMPFV